MNLTILPAALLALVCLGSCNGTGRSGAAAANGVLTSQGEKSTANTGEGQPIHLTRAEFLSKVYDFEKSPKNWVYSGEKPCIIDFYADWCRPCKLVAPIMAELAEKYNGRIIVYKINIDEEKELAGFFGIQSIPTVLLCPMSGPPQMTQGALPKETFEKAVNEVLLVKTN